MLYVCEHTLSCCWHLQECALLTDGRFSGGSHGFVVGHICPEAQVCFSFCLSTGSAFVILQVPKQTLM